MKVFYLAILTTILTFCLLVIGGIVNPSGASLACPDWPTCYGSFFPKMSGGVIIEHSHRILASLVGFLTCILALSIWKGRPSDRAAHWLGIGALLLVILQGLFGGITVLMKLPMVVSSAHLALSMIFFSYMIFLCFRLWPGREGKGLFAPLRVTDSNRVTDNLNVTNIKYAQKWAVIAASTVYFQIVLGAIVRHSGAGRVCGDDFLLCMGQLWPIGWAGELHMFHRFMALVTLAVVIVAHIKIMRVARENGKSFTLKLSKLPPTIVLLQIIVGAGMVKRWVAVPEATTHLALAAILLASFVVLYFMIETQTGNLS